ncbi:MAG: DUF5063 domain-containing protein [Bacteroidales bacterium]|jgi:hypothetical protein|nr:DUF5063 domain-containing protein [Bacteroidales bacterium]MDD4213963.1 DUF5063 domain-containing protein [Bacteroidales bacterium]
MKKESEDMVKSKNVLEFITVANELCLFLEEIEKYDVAFIFAYLQRVLPLVYIKGSMLPDIEPVNKELTERYVTQEDWERIFNLLRNKIGKCDRFEDSEIPGNPDEADSLSISENLADIYQDLKDFLILYQKNTHTARENAVYSCRMHFGSQWGLKILNAHKSIHQMIFGNNKKSGNLFIGFSSN